MKAHINGAEIFYERSGKGKPMFIMHGGLGLDHTYFRPWLDGLSDQIELIFYDHRGNGRSERPSSMDGITHQTWIEDADALREYLGFEKIILFGHSYGGFLAMEYALRFPEHLEGLILCDTAPVMDYMPVIQENAAKKGTPDSLAALGEVFTRPMNDYEDWRSHWMRILPLYFKKYDPVICAAMDEKTSYSPAAWNHANVNCLPFFNTLERLKDIKTPTLVIGGADDWIMTKEQSARIHASLPDSQLLIIEESGHFPFIEENDRFMASMEKWISNLGQHQ